MKDKDYNFIKNINFNKNTEAAKELHGKESREKLENIITKRIKTTMIGAVAAVEESLKQFWDNGGEKLTEEQERIFNLFQEMRSKILDNGNNQIRLIEKDLDNFNVELKIYHISFPVIPMATRNKK